MLVASLVPGEARIERRRPLRYRRGADPALDRPAHVRAASTLCWVGGELIVVQDDAAFLGLVDPATALVDDLPLPPGPGGRRLFDDRIGNKAEKRDLEVALDDDGHLVALGSGGLPARQGAVRWRPGQPPTWQPLPDLYAALSATIRPLNLEGGCFVRDQLLLAHRGGDASTGTPAPDLLFRLSRAAFRQHLDGGTVPALSAEPVDLGTLADVPLHFTEVSATPTHIAYAAVAEATASFFLHGRPGARRRPRPAPPHAPRPGPPRRSQHPGPRQDRGPRPVWTRPLDAVTPTTGSP